MSIKSNKYIISKYKTIKHYKYWEVTVTGEIVSVVGQPVCSLPVSQLATTVQPEPCWVRHNQPVYLLDSQNNTKHITTQH